MKKIILLLTSFLLLLLSLFSADSYGFVAVQRTANSSFQDFAKYVKSIQGQNFLDAYLDLSAKIATPSVSLESCLEKVYLGRPDSEDCMRAVQALSAYPLNSESREILYTLLNKIEGGGKMSVFKDLKHGLRLTHPLLDHEIRVVPAKDLSSKAFVGLEAKAFAKALSKKIGYDYIILINGRRLSSWNGGIPPAGIYQWSLISNTHEPFILISNFSKFASIALQNMKAFAENCRQLDDYEIEKKGLLEVQVFASEKCIAKEMPYGRPKEHLADLSTTPAPSSVIASKSWIWPVIALVGVGIAGSLKGKNVQITWPGSN